MVLCGGGGIASGGLSKAAAAAAAAANYQKWRSSSYSNFLGLPVSSPCNSRTRSRTRPPALPRSEMSSDDDDAAKGGEGEPGPGGGGGSRKKAFSQSPPPVSITLDDVNPVGLGRRSRQIFDEVWRKFSGLGQISRTPTEDSETILVRGPMCEFTVPEAQDTTVLVVGATSRIGRIVVRKLMLRGYKVKVLYEARLDCFQQDWGAEDCQECLYSELSGIAGWEPS